VDIRKNFREGLRDIQDEVLVMGNMVEKATLRSVEALKNRDLALAQQVCNDDITVNEKRFEIEERCIQLIATQQPMASDLRMLISVLSVITDLERIGDHAEGIAKIAVMLCDEPPVKPYVDIPRMAEKTADMLHRSLDAFFKRDADAAVQIAAEDDVVDELYDQLFRELISYMMEDPKTITRATRLVWVAHNLERSADRITNICERVIFLVTGRMEELGTSKYQKCYR